MVNPVRSYNPGWRKGPVEGEKQHLEENHDIYITRLAFSVIFNILLEKCNITSFTIILGKLHDIYFIEHISEPDFFWEWTWRFFQQISFSTKKAEFEEPLRNNLNCWQVCFSGRVRRKMGILLWEVSRYWWTNRTNHPERMSWYS